jgi:hypothetical protein
MADLSQTAANVSLTDSAGVVTRLVQYGETVSQGMPVYKKTSDSKYWKADADAVDTASADGIALTPGAANEYGIIIESGLVDIGATLTVGATYVVSTTAGAIAPIADLASGDFTTILGVATTAGKLLLDIYESGVAKA